MTKPDEFRSAPGMVLDERAMLDAYLDWHRGTLLWKCSGLTDEQLTTAASPPADLTLLGLVRHLTEVENGWFDSFGDMPPVRYSSAEAPDADFEQLDSHPVAEVFARYRTQLGHSRTVCAARALDDTAVTSRGEEFSLRWLYLHMIEEYARHNGHADLLRQAIDGATGE